MSAPRRRQPHPPIRATALWSLRKVMATTTLSKSVLYQLMKRQLFPRPIHTTGKTRAVCWVDSEVLDWVNEQAANAERVGTGRVAIPNSPWSREAAPASAPADG